MAVGQPTFITSFGNNTDVKNAFGNTPQDGNYAWEWWYKFQVTDNISVTPAIFYLSNPLGAAGFSTNQATGFNAGSAALTNFGGLVKTTFKF
jgi:carbohydrate-selective porin OprB